MKTTKKCIGSSVCVAFAVLAISISCEKTDAAEATDYSIAAHWLSAPSAANMPVDIFYLYPTAWTSTNPNPEVCAIDNPSMLAQAPVVFAGQATAFETIGNIYAPFYRQSNLTSNAPAIVAGIPTTDAMAAFDYYINNYNNGRPFILAGHSQGANVLSNLLAEYMKGHPEVYVRMIAAYVIGFPVTAEYLTNNPYLKFAEGADDTGVIISYNTQAPDVPPGVNPILWGMVGTVINPITWTRSTTLATTNQGVGSFMPNTNGVYVRVSQYADARIDISNGVLICSTADTNALGAISALAGFGVFHNFDYSFYYYNIRSNAANRTAKFLNKYAMPAVCADIDGDRLADLVTVVGSNWYVWFSTAQYLVRGGPYDLGVIGLPTTGDIDGDGLSDLITVIGSNWYVWFSTSQYLVRGGPYDLGISGAPTTGDVDGDGLADLISVVGSNWYAWFSTAQYLVRGGPYDLGISGTPTTGDIDGDGLADLITVAGSNWYVWFSTAQYLVRGGPYDLGISGTPATGDIDGDRLADLIDIESTTGGWYVWFSTSQYQVRGGPFTLNTP